jgi:hypothetical protein
VIVEGRKCTFFLIKMIFFSSIIRKYLLAYKTYDERQGNHERPRIKWKPTHPCKLWKLQSKPHNVDPKEGSWEVGGVICKSAFANHPSHLSWFLHITPPTFYKSSLGSRSCGSDWSFHSLHGEIGFHLICFHHEKLPARADCLAG